MAKQASRRLTRLLSSYVTIGYGFNDCNSSHSLGATVSAQDLATVPSPSAVAHSQDILTRGRVMPPHTHTCTPFCSVPTTNEVWTVPSSNQKVTTFQEEAL